MSDPNVDKWRQKGRFYLWTYKENTKNYPGWHMTVDSIGATALLELFELMSSAKYSAIAKLQVSEPDKDILKVPNNKNGAAKWSSVPQLKIKYPKDQCSDNHWVLNKNNGEFTLELGKNKLEEIKKGILDISNQEGDYAIGPDNDQFEYECLWFWWN